MHVFLYSAVFGSVTWHLMNSGSVGDVAAHAVRLLIESDVRHV